MPTITNLIGLGLPPEQAVEVSNGSFAALGVKTRVATNDVNDTTPTAAELTTSFGTPASVGTGFIGVVRDANLDTNCFVVVSNGTSYYYLKFTKAL